MTHTHTLADLAAPLCLGASGVALIALALVFADADFDPRPAAAQLVESGRVDALLVAVANARHDVRLTLRDAAISAAALLLILSGPQEVTRMSSYRIDGPIPFTVTPTEAGADINIERYLIRALFTALFEAADNDPEGFGDEFADMHRLAISAQHNGGDSNARHEFDTRMDAYLTEFLGEPVISLYGGGVRQLRDAMTQIATPRPVPGQREAGAA